MRETEQNHAERIARGEETVAVVGLGYVGLPVALAFARIGGRVVGFDTDARKIGQYRSGRDPSGEMGDRAVRESGIHFTSDEKTLREAGFIVVAVPTPVQPNHSVDLSCLAGACEIIGRNIAKGAIVVFESTVYPGVTEDYCVPILEKASGLQCGADFAAGYSPERINPGDKAHTFENIRKVVAGINDDVAGRIAGVYALVVKAGVHLVSNIRTAEAIKVVENTQRDINIAYMNECAMLFRQMGIDTREVLGGMSTKWNALNFTPGLVGGHCISVDPYYLISEAERIGFRTELMAVSRRINERMSGYIAEEILREFALANKKIKNARIAVLGITYKENCSDLRNSKAAQMVRALQAYGADVLVCDPVADPEEVRTAFGFSFSKIDELRAVDCVVLAVTHKAFKALSVAGLKEQCAGRKDEEDILFDIKGFFNRKAALEAGFRYISL
jgi:UDP-N-acetyl-D-galactosamine dehydrogenase